MVRPSPQIIGEEFDLVVTEATDIYYLTYNGKPINLYKRYTGAEKYRRVASVNAAHLLTKAKELNKMLYTDKFAVYQLKEGKPYVTSTRTRTSRRRVSSGN